MRTSRYTIEVEGENGTRIFYNSANGALAAYCDGEEPGDEFLTELAPEEELAVQRAIFEAQKSDHAELSLVLAPTYACNLRCPYCYELGHNSIKGKMSAEVMDAILAFVADRFEAHAFERLCVQWYGGDPSLALDVVEELSVRLIEFCESHGAAYEAMMLTNCNVIDEAAVDMLARLKVTSVFITIDGLEETHNARRVSAVGLNSFERNVEAAKLFASRGILVRANMNADHVNWPQFEKLRDYLREQAGVDLTFSRLCDYGHFFGTRDFKKPAFDLFDHEEFCRHVHDQFVADGVDDHRIRMMLSPAPRFCKGQRDDYFVIDTLGDVYLCDGYIGEQDHVVGNVVRGDLENALGRISHNPYEDEQCSACELLPLCQGNCDWERKASGMACHPLRTTIADYLRDWQACCAS